MLPSKLWFELADQAIREGLAPAGIGVLRFIAQGKAYEDIARALMRSIDDLSNSP